MFSMHVACDMHTTVYSQYCDMHVSLNMHGSCMHITCKKFPLDLWAKTSRTEIPDLFFLASFHSRDQVPPAINSPATATRLIKCEHLV